MSENKLEKELTGFFLKRFFEQAKELQSQINPANVEKTTDTLIAYLDQMLDFFQLISLETKLKDLQNLNKSILTSFDCGVIFGMLLQHLDNIESLLDVIEENKALRDKVRQIETMMPKPTEDLSYIR